MSSKIKVSNSIQVLERHKTKGVKQNERQVMTLRIPPLAQIPLLKNFNSLYHLVSFLRQRIRNTSETKHLNSIRTERPLWTAQFESNANASFWRRFRSILRSFDRSIVRTIDRMISIDCSIFFVWFSFLTTNASLTVIQELPSKLLGRIMHIIRNQGFLAFVISWSSPHVTLKGKTATPVSL